jgi:type II secretory pathway pseudopilin PulG
MNRHESIRCRAVTLLEVILVMGILVAITAIVVPNFYTEYRATELPGSARQFRSLLTMVSARAALDGKRYRLRFPMEDEEDLLGGDRQPLIEREDNPFDEPEVFNEVTDTWVIGNTLLGDVWCAEVRPGRPTVELLEERRNRIEEALEEAREEFEPERPPIMFEPDARTGWVTFVLTNAPRGTDIDDLEDYEAIEVILEGETGMVWLQRPLYEEELDLFDEKNWPIVLRQDFLDPRVLTEDDVLELHESLFRP